MIPIEKTANKQDAIRISSEKLQQLFYDFLDKPVLFLSSGGSAFQILDTIPSDLISHTMTIGVLDDRYSIDPAINNFAQLTSTGFYTNVVKKGCSFINTTVIDGESGEAHATRFENTLQNWRQEHSDGVVIATAGMGADGHTSGIMPFPEDPEKCDKLFNTSRWVVYYDALGKSSYPLRSTTTFTFLKNEIDHAIFFISGDDKKEAFNRMISDSGTLAETPARIAHEMKNVVVVTDLT